MKHERVDNPEDVVKKGDRVTVKLVDRDERGRLRLSMKALVAAPRGHARSVGGAGESRTPRVTAIAVAEWWRSWSERGGAGNPRPRR